ncbi:hypothetical protein BZB76_3428 [Actinomadura pelletieri DSM 43383]|uniref:Uncharacterized protein n=1 Tax=Actinomadura pelletieri DSM 43383 TaxID=1120940 RepID=A0A495QPL9_9ACTN|nr:hypothetical protein [Actinomadura pelletieri]RKS74905.1 hypothetical protein BZB76_3428 [Actinomadura pelletieri DSM 43383]
MRVRPDQAEPRPLISTRALVIILTAVGAAVLAALAPRAAIPIGVGVGVVTLLAQIVRD